MPSRVKTYANRQVKTVLKCHIFICIFVEKLTNMHYKNTKVQAVKIWVCFLAMILYVPFCKSAFFFAYAFSVRINVLHINLLMAKYILSYAALDPYKIDRFAS